MTYKTIDFEVTNGYARIMLNRPDSLNSFNAMMHEEIADAFQRVSREAQVRAVLITGAGRGFCAGQDLSDRSVKADTDPVDLGETLDKYYNPLIRAIRDLPKPVVCAVNGVAAGAGANIALACDIVIAADTAKFVQAFCKIGLLPDSGGTWVLPRLIGMARAKAVAMLGTPIAATVAAEWGLIYKSVPAADLDTEARQLCMQFAFQPTLGLAAIKMALGQSFDNDLDTQLDLERDTQRRLGVTADYQEGVAAFLEKRSPHFHGR